MYCLTKRDLDVVGGVPPDPGNRGGGLHGRSMGRDETSRNSSSRTMSRSSSPRRPSAWGSTSPILGSSSTTKRPASFIAYYQQVGRAGRQLDLRSACCWRGREDDDIQTSSSPRRFPPSRTCPAVLESLREKPGQSLGDLEGLVNLRRSRLAGDAQDPRGRRRGLSRTVEVVPLRIPMGLSLRALRRGHPGEARRAAGDAGVRRHRRVPHGVPSAPTRRPRRPEMRALRQLRGRPVAAGHTIAARRRGPPPPPR